LVNQRQYPLPTFDTSHAKRWVKQTCESVKAGELSYNRDIEIYYVNDYMKYGEETRILNSMVKFLNKSNDEEIFFFHGTTEIAAQSIVSRGIKFQRRNARPGDFGYGFYTTNNFFRARKLAEKRARSADEGTRPACLVFVMAKDKFNSHQIVRLLYKETQDEFTRQ